MAELKSTIVKGNLRVTDDADIKNIKENGTNLSDKYLGKTAKASDADKLDGNDSSYFQKALPTTTTAGKVLKSTSTAGTVQWSDDTNTNQTIKAGSVTFGDNDVVDIVAGDNVSVTGATTGTGAPKITISATYSDATTSASGLMSFTDKTKLNGIASGAEVNVQSDWNITDNTSDAFIKNKPTIPTVDYPVTDVKVNNTSILSNKVANLVTNSTYNATTNKIATMSDLPNTSNFIQKSDTSGLVKNDGTIDTTSYSTFSGSYNDLSNKPTIPATNVIPTTTTGNKVLLSTTTSGTAKWSAWTNEGLLKTNTSGVVSVDTTSYLKDVKINDTSIVSNANANIVTNSAYNSSTNKIATMSDVPTKSSWNYDDTYVKYSATQSLTPAQKTTARSNIGAITCGSSTTTQNNIATWSDGFGGGLLDSGYTIAKSVPSNAVFTDTATAADNILDGSNSGTTITYAPYSATTATSTWVSNETNARKIYLGTVNPTREERINLNGYLYSTKVYSGGELVTTNSSSKWNDYYLASNPNGYTSNTGTVTSVRVQAGTGLSSSTSTAQTSTLNTTISVASGYKLPTTTEWNSKSSITANPSSTTNTITSIGIDGTNYALGTAIGVATNTGTCTNTGTARTVTVSGTYTLSSGATAIVMFTNYVYNNSTLNINSTGAKTMRVNGAAISSSNTVSEYIPYFCRYDGTYQQLYAIGHNQHEHVSTLTFKENFGSTSYDAVVTIRWSDDYSYKETTSFFNIFTAIVSGRATINGYFKYSSTVKCPIMFGDAYYENTEEDTYYHIRLYWFRSTSASGEIDWIDNWPTSNFSIVDKLV